MDDVTQLQQGAGVDIKPDSQQLPLPAQTANYQFAPGLLLQEPSGNGRSDVAGDEHQLADPDQGLLSTQQQHASLSTATNASQTAIPSIRRYDLRP